MDLIRQHGANRRVYIRYPFGHASWPPSTGLEVDHPGRQLLPLPRGVTHTLVLDNRPADCSAEMLGCEAVLRHISERFGAKMHLEPATSSSFACMGPGKQVRHGVKPGQPSWFIYHSTNDAMPMVEAAAAQL